MKKYIVTLYSTKYERKEVYSTTASSIDELKHGLVLLTENGYDILDISEG